jgi:hypothetical protein
MNEEELSALRGQIGTTQEMFANILPSLNAQNEQTMSLLQTQLDTMRETFSSQIEELSRPQKVSSTITRTPTLTPTTGQTLGEVGERRESISRDFTSSRWRINRRNTTNEVPMANTGIATTQTQQRQVYAGLRI